MKKCNNNKLSIVQNHFLFKVTLWLTILSISSNLTEGSHLPADYVAKALESEETFSSSETTQDGYIADETSTFSQPINDIDTSSAESKTTSEPSSTTTLQHKVIRQDDEVTVISSTSTTTTSSVNAERSDTDIDNINSVNANGKRYNDIEASCDDKQMTIVGQFVNRFKGRIYAYGYPDETECGVTSGSSPNQNVSFNIPIGQCGVQMLSIDPEFDETKRHEVTLYVQYSSFLQQVIDDKVTVSCVEIKRNPMEDSLQYLESGEGSPSRQGRRMGVVKDTPAQKSGQTKISSTIGESWMEVLAGKDPSPKSRKMLPVSVGEDVTLVISTKVMRGYDARIVNCSANDGTRIGSIDGYRSQQILDSAGCSVDTALVPNFRRRRLPIESRNRMITLHFATFPAFKFPERDHLHIKCMVAYCQGPCPQEPCDSGINHFGTWREKYGRIADALIDTAEIVNSVEVTAPELEDTTGGGHYFERHQSGGPGSYSSGGGSATDVSSRQFSDTSSKSHLNNGNSHSPPSASSSTSGDNQVPLLQPSFVSGGGSVCVSPGSVILALVILGVVLVISATATLWFALKRSEAKKYRQAVKHTPFQHGPQPYYRFSHW